MRKTEARRRAPGAGRPKKAESERLAYYSLRLPPTLIEWLDSQGGRAFAREVLQRARTESLIV